MWRAALGGDIGAMATKGLERLGHFAPGRIEEVVTKLRAGELDGEKRPATRPLVILAQEAYRSGKGLIEIIREQKALTEDQIKDILDPVKLANLDRSKYQRAAQNQQNQQNK